MPHSEITPVALLNRFLADCQQEHKEILELSALADRRPDLAPLITILIQGGHRRAATKGMISALHPRQIEPARLQESPAAPPAAPPVPPGWWGRLRAAWKILFPGRQSNY